MAVCPYRNFAPCQASFRSSPEAVVTAAVVRAWVVASEARLQEVLAARTLAAWEETEAVVLQRYEAGLTNPLDLRLARASSASAAMNPKAGQCSPSMIWSQRSPAASMLPSVM